MNTTTKANNLISIISVDPGVLNMNVKYKYWYIPLEINEKYSFKSYIRPDKTISWYPLSGKTP